jgi:hypothetical protein
MIIGFRCAVVHYGVILESLEGMTTAGWDQQTTGVGSIKDDAGYLQESG